MDFGRRSRLEERGTGGGGGLMLMGFWPVVVAAGLQRGQP